MVISDRISDMAKPKSTSIQRVVDRPGEGTIVTTHRHESVNVDGTTGVTLTVDLSTAPVPERRYVADVVAVERIDDAARLIFGQCRVGRDDLRSLVVIRMPAAAVHQFLSTIDDVKSSMEGFVKQFRIKKGELSAIDQEPPQTVALEATIIVSSFSGRQACMDFYYSSPYVAFQVTRGGRFAIEPVARVMLPTNMLLSVCNALEQMKDDLPNDVMERSV